MRNLFCKNCKVEWYSLKILRGIKLKNVKCPICKAKKLIKDRRRKNEI